MANQNSHILADPKQPLGGLSFTSGTVMLLHSSSLSPLFLLNEGWPTNEMFICIFGKDVSKLRLLILKDFLIPAELFKMAVNILTHHPTHSSPKIRLERPLTSYSHTEMTSNAQKH